PARQQTMRQTIEWSYNLLAPAEQRLFRLLGVFAGGCTVAAVEALAGSGSSAGALWASSFDLLAALVDNSLIRQLEADEGAAADEPRLMMLAVLREFAIERLEAEGEAVAARRAHALYYLALAEAATERFNMQRDYVPMRR